MDRDEATELGNLLRIVYPELFANSRWPDLIIEK
jgi:hypothetical protein